MKIVNGNSGCKNCINRHTNNTCQSVIKEQVSKGLRNCLEDDKLNYIYEKENEMKLTKDQKKQMKVLKAELAESNGFIHIYENGITQVFIPASKAKDNRMFKYGQSVCNETDKYKRKYGIHLAFNDLFNSNKLMPVELIIALENLAEVI